MNKGKARGSQQPKAITEADRTSNGTKLSRMLSEEPETRRPSAPAMGRNGVGQTEPQE